MMPQAEMIDRPHHVANDWRAGRVRKVSDLSTHTRRSEGSAAPGREVWSESKLTPEQLDHARKLTDKGEPAQYVADLPNVGRSTLYLALVR
jgi:hypothetical protein